MEFMSEIISTAASMLNAGPEADISALESMCAAAAAEITGRLRQDVTPDVIRETFVTAAGVLAISMYIQLADAKDDTSSLKVGDVSVGRRGQGAIRASAASLRRQAETMLRDYLRDNGFSFRGVTG